jgi:hypothetical protein
VSTRMSRRTLLRGGAALGVALFVPFGRGGSGGAVAVALEPGGPGFLTDTELQTLKALVDRFVPGQPEDLDPGAVAAGCAEAIDALLAAFAVDPPRIYAGGPFSDRGGAAHNDFAEFLPLDDYEATAWRLRIEGSAGRPDLEFNGPVPGLQAVYRDGLAALDAAAGGAFAALPGPARDLVLRSSDDPAVAALVDVAFPHTLEFLYGAPEYGGNRDLVGWENIGWDGDVQPRGYTREEVEHPDDPGPVGALPDLPAGVTQTDLAAVAPFAFSEAAMGLYARTDGRFSAMQAEVQAVVAAVRGRATRGA